jgi:hypothetical protein
MIEHKLTKYPRDLRENRQGLKLLIIPAGATLLATLFTISITMLVLSKNGESGGVSAAIVIPLIAFIFLITICRNIQQESSQRIREIDEIRKLAENSSRESHKISTERIITKIADEFAV